MRKKKVNKKYKDRLFRLVFEDRKDLLELYNAVNGSHYDNPADLEITTLDDAVYIGMKNDISFLIGDILNLYEHQSSYNPNMPIRGLLYLADVYRKIIDQQKLNVYSNTRLSLPYPKYVVFYNGTQKAPDRIEMKLSDSFNSELTRELSLEFVAVMLNINVGHNKEIMEECRRLKDYSSFVGEVRLLTNEGMSLRTAVDTAIDTCIERDILADILSAHRAEVRDMCLYDYDFEKHMELERKEWEGIGLEKGLADGKILNLISLIRKKQEKGFTIEEISNALEEEIAHIGPIFTLIRDNPDLSDEIVLRQISKELAILPR